MASGFRNVLIGVTRAKAIAKSCRPEPRVALHRGSQASTARGNEIAKILDSLPVADRREEAARRHQPIAQGAYLACARRDDEGHATATTEANHVYERSSVVAAPIYVAAMQAYLDYQRSTIDTMAHGIQSSAHAARSTSPSSAASRR